jgi:hypothetical protein
MNFKDIINSISFPPQPIEKYSKQEKRLCPRQEQAIQNHVEGCPICKASFNSSKKFGIPTKPACKKFLETLRTHIDNCSTCMIAETKHNEDSITITQDMRDVIELIPSMETVKNPREFIAKLKTLKGSDLEKIERVKGDLLKRLYDKK